MRGQNAQQRGGGIPRPWVDLWRAESQSEPVGALPEDHWGEAGDASCDWSGAWVGNGGGDGGGVEGWRSLCAAGPIVSGATPAIHFRGQCSGGAAGAE